MGNVVGSNQIKSHRVRTRYANVCVHANKTEIVVKGTRCLGSDELVFK